MRGNGGASDDKEEEAAGEWMDLLGLPSVDFSLIDTAGNPLDDPLGVRTSGLLLDDPELVFVK